MDALPDTPVVVVSTQNNWFSNHKKLFIIGLFIFLSIIILVLFYFFRINKPNISSDPLTTQVNQFITLAQNPDKELIVKYGLLTGSLDANTQEIINGDKNPPPGVFVKRGLNDLKTALETGNNPEAKAIIKDIVERSLLGYIFTPAGTDVAGSTVRLTDEEIKAIDPNNNFPSLKAKGRRGEVSVVRKELLVGLVRFFNQLK